MTADQTKSDLNALTQLTDAIGLKKWLSEAAFEALVEADTMLTHALHLMSAENRRKAQLACQIAEVPADGSIGYAGKRQELILLTKTTKKHYLRSTVLHLKKCNIIIDCVLNAMSMPELNRYHQMCHNLKLDVNNKNGLKNRHEIIEKFEAVRHVLYPKLAKKSAIEAENQVKNGQLGGAKNTESKEQTA